MNKLCIPIIVILIFMAGVIPFEGCITKKTYEIEEVTIYLESNYGYDICVRSIGPKLSKYPEEHFPAVLQIGGGWGTSIFMLDHHFAKIAASKGLIIVAFGTEPKLQEEIGSSKRDYNGFKDQDDVAIVLRSIFNCPNVNPNMVGVWSNSNGITLAAGVLGREKYQNLSEKVMFLLDSEGPHCPKEILNNPNITFYNPDIVDVWNTVIDAKVGPDKDYQSVEDFFAERCAVYFIDDFKGIYQRVQAKNDHALTNYYGHAVAMLNAATNGEAKWTRLNKQPKNQTYASLQEPDGVDIETVLDVEKFTSCNDYRIWDVLFDLFNQ